MTRLSRVMKFVAVAFSAMTAVPASADFIETFDGAGYVVEDVLPSPWTGGFQFNNPMRVTPAPSGFGGTQGANNPTPNWEDADRSTNYNVNELVHVLSWKARLSTANGIPRLNVGIGNAAGGRLIFEMNGQPDTIAWSIQGPDLGSVSIIHGDWYQMTVTLTNDGSDNWSWAGQYAHYNGASFDAPLPMGSGTFVSGWLPETVSMQSIYAFYETNGTSAIDDVSFGIPVTLHPGDFDSDGDVDGADFVAWQTHFPTSSGATLADGDADADGDVDGADFVVWQTNFPFTPGPGVLSVPEPTAVLLAVLGIIGLGSSRWLAKK